MKRFKTKRITGNLEDACYWLNRTCTKDTTDILKIHVVSNNHIIILYTEEVDKDKFKNEFKYEFKD